VASLADDELAERALNRASPLDREHKRLADQDLFGTTISLTPSAEDVRLISPASSTKLKLCR
jgi:hypothetical protein